MISCNNQKLDLNIGDLSNNMHSIIMQTFINFNISSDIHSPNDLWDALKESRDVDSATPINRFDLESFTAHMDNNGQLHQKLLRVDAEPANIDPCHRLLILKFVD
ncbi:unnamed protein product [Adineta steineri]|uniref:Uncharacterized protein n=1 Tax=Adineta steineri TaxID=433720 RepID=A0A814IZT1_9BILA|nr:unnamed protein product [Adineta steineri]